jgi:hypothetical protein
MSKLKPIDGKIPAFYRLQAIDLAVFFWVEAKRKYAVDWEFKFNINQAIVDFQQTFELSEDELPLDSAVVKYQRAKNLLTKL